MRNETSDSKGYGGDLQSGTMMQDDDTILFVCVAATDEDRPQHRFKFCTSVTTIITNKCSYHCRQAALESCLPLMTAESFDSRQHESSDERGSTAWIFFATRGKQCLHKKMVVDAPFVQNCFYDNP